MRSRLLCLAFVLTTAVRADELQDRFKEAFAALKKGDEKKALKLADEAVKDHPKDPNAYALRASLREALGRFADAVADLDESLKLDPKRADLINHRGDLYFKLGRIKESVADFDRFIELRPAEFPGHWKRGISLYYAGRYDDGRKQFEGYEKVDTNDVENAVWHYLCNVRVVGRDKARAALLKIGNDKRVPMMVVYKMFKGDAKPEDVLAAAQSEDVPKEMRNRALFYAHLYLGLYWESEGDKKKALEHLTQASTKYRIGHYMGDVARVHAELLAK